MLPAITRILSFWFGESRIDPAAVPAGMQRWFGVDADFDAEIAARFSSLCEQAAVGELTAWERTPHGRLALILLLDQFPRNIYRGTPQAFAGDAQGARICLEGLARGDDTPLSAIERGFFYLPLQHAEQAPLQEQSVRCYRRLLDEVGRAWRPAIQGMLDYAVEHCEIIQRFGRFPHRNAILGRESTPEEQRFMADGATSFGQSKRGE